MDELKILEDQKILEEEFKGSSDRAAAIVGASYLDELLRELLLNYLVEDTRKNDKQLFSGNGPLSTFSARIDLAYRFGVISEYEKKQLHIIRGIRNDFAHTLSGASFENESIKQRALNSSVSIKMLVPKFIPLPQHENDTPPLPIIEKAKSDNPREIFQETVGHVALLLRGRQVYCLLNRVEKKKPFKSPIEPTELIQQYYESLRDKHKRLLVELVKNGGEVTKDDRAFEKYDLLFRVNKFCIGQTANAHKDKNYA